MIVTTETFDGVLESLGDFCSLDCETLGLYYYKEHELFSIIISDDKDNYYFNFKFMISLLISLAIFAVIVYVVYLVLGLVVGNLPPVAQQIVWIIAALVCLLVLLNILGIGGGELGSFRLR